MAINLDKYAWEFFRHGRKAHLIEISVSSHNAICGKVGIPTGVIRTVPGHIAIPVDFLPSLLCNKCINKLSRMIYKERDNKENVKGEKMKALRIEVVDENGKFIPNLVDTNIDILDIPIEESYIDYANKTFEYFVDELFMSEYEVGTKLSFSVVELDMTLEQYKEKYDDVS